MTYPEIFENSLQCLSMTEESCLDFKADLHGTIVAYDLQYTRHPYDCRRILSHGSKYIGRAPTLAVVGAFTRRLKSRILQVARDNLVVLIGL